MCTNFTEIHFWPLLLLLLSKASELKKLRTMLLLLLTSWQAYCKKPGTISQTIDGLNFERLYEWSEFHLPCPYKSTTAVLKLGGWNFACSIYSGYFWPLWPLRPPRSNYSIDLRFYWRSWPIQSEAPRKQSGLIHFLFCLYIGPSNQRTSKKFHDWKAITLIELSSFFSPTIKSKRAFRSHTQLFL